METKLARISQLSKENPDMPGKWICYKNAWVQKLKAKSL